VSCPVSNLVIGGSRTLSDITVPFDGLAKWGVRVIHDEALDIDPLARTVKLARGAALAYDRLILSPGVDFIYDDIPSLVTRKAQDLVLHAWKAGPQTVALRAQLEAMPDGGVFAIHIPKAPFRCPPAPYERACQVAHYFSTSKKKSRIIVLDSNEEIQSKKALFAGAWETLYKGIIDYRPNSSLVDVDLATRTLKLDFDDVRADVINVIPPQRAGAIARRLGMANANDRFCQVDFLTYESTAQRGVHVLGDSIQVAPLMPKSGHMANQHAKVCAAAVVALLSGADINPMPVIANTCYSYVDDRRVGHVTSVHAYDRAQKTMLVVPGSGGLSLTANEAERVFAEAWARNIWADMLA
jgi:sulfide dehydrogenase [flavocytochrome c] flavoprotein subunit